MDQAKQNSVDMEAAMASAVRTPLKLKNYQLNCALETTQTVATKAKAPSSVMQRVAAVGTMNQRSR